MIRSREICGGSIACLLLLVVAAFVVSAVPCHGGVSFPTNNVDGDLLLDIGDHASKPNLGFGWGRGERGASGHFRWIWRMEADLFFELETARDAELWINAAVLYLPYRRQVIAIYVNGKYATEWICADDSGFLDYRVDLSGDLFKAGRNTVTLRMGYRKRGNDDRDLSLAVDRVLLRFP